MSLIDADKNNVQRKSPSINAPDTVLNRMAHKTSQTTYRESGSEVIARAVLMQGGLMFVDSENRVSGLFMYIPEASSIPILATMKSGDDFFVDGYGGTVERPKV